MFRVNRSAIPHVQGESPRNALLQLDPTPMRPDGPARRRVNRLVEGASIVAEYLTGLELSWILVLSHIST